MGSLTTFDRNLRTLKRNEPYDAKEVRKTEQEMQNVQDQIAEIRKEQQNQFQALSNEDQRRMCEVVGLEYLKRAVSAGEEALPEGDTLSASDKREEALQDGVDLSQEVNKRVKAPPRRMEKASEMSDKQTQPSQDQNDALRVQKERAERWRNAAEFVPRPHKRIEELRGITVPPSNNYISQAQHQHQHQQELWSEYEAQRQMAALVSQYSVPYGADIDDMLRENLERQLAMKQGLRRSKEDILQMQEDIRREEEMVGRRLPRVDIDVEAFLRERDVGPQSDDDEREEGAGARG